VLTKHSADTELLQQRCDAGECCLAGVLHRGGTV
jgi:hypothetical protein